VSAAAAAVRTVLFDWGGTLTPWHTVDLFAQWWAYADAYDPDDGRTADELAAALLAQEDEAWRAGREHQRSATLDEIFTAVGVEPSGPRHERALIAYQAFWEPHTFTDDDVIPLFLALKARGIKIGVLSNTVWTRAFHEEVFRRDGVLDLIDGAIYTSEIAYTKPHPEAFAAAMSAVGEDDAGACVFVGDRPFDDIHGAKEAGMRAVLLPHSAIPPSQHGHTMGEPDAVIQRLAELLPLVDAWTKA
jgi:putative hydrolase of the HAD superfamily